MNNENDRKILIDFVKELKTTQINKMNSATFKMATLISFLIVCVVWVINNFPNSFPSSDHFFLLFIYVSVFLSTAIIIFNQINSLFRTKHLEKNIYGIFNKVERQFMFPVLFIAFWESSIWFVLNLLIIVFIFVKDSYWNFLASSIVLSIMAIFMVHNTLIPIHNNFPKIKDEEHRYKKPNKINKVYVLIHYLSLLMVCYNLFFLWDSGLLLNNKKTMLFSIYITGFVLSVFYIFRTLSYRILYSWIEDFYIEIHLNNLSHEAILDRLNSEFSIGRNLETVNFYKDLESEFVEDDDIT